MNLLIEYFKSQNTSRDQEYIFCIKQNISNPLIEKIHVFISDESILNENSEKLQIVKLDKRPTFYDLMEYCNLNLEGQKCIIGNTDIIFDDSIGNLKEFEFENQFIALTRWDLYQKENNWYINYYHNLWWNPSKDGSLNENESIFTSEFSQDSWIFSSPIKLDDRAKFMMGKPGCDNRISQLMHENGYNVINPSRLIKTLHFHQTNYRTYNNNTDMVLGPYLLIKPTDNLREKPLLRSIPHF
jgi:hypothetical protein